MYPSGKAVKRKISFINDGDEPSRYSKIARAQSEQLAGHDRNIPQSKDGNNKRASSVGATQNCPWPSKALEQDISQSENSDSNSDGDSDNASNRNHSDSSSFKSSGVHGEQLKRSTSERWEVSSTDEGGKCCPKCEAMTGTPEGLSALLGNEGYKHFNWYDLQKSAGAGCGLCGTIRDVTETEDWDCEDDGSRTREEIRVFANGSRLPPNKEARPPGHPLQDIQLKSLEVMIPLDRSLAHGHEWGEIFYLVAFEADPASKFVTGRRDSKELSSHVVEEIHRRLDSCFNDHKFCPGHCIPELPSRVLDVGTANSPVRLYEAQKGEKSQYVALSYCWGDETRQVKTTTLNYAEHTLQLPCSLPQTISDAIEVCRKLGFRYIWIDALCIIQDSNNDKQNEIAKMGSIYKSATVVIVAACAASVSDGFLSNGPQDSIMQLPFFVGDSTSGKVYLRVKDGEHTYEADEPIFERAWTFQEFVLPPRALVFDSHQIHFKCLENGAEPLFQTHLEFDLACPDLPKPLLVLTDQNLAKISSQRKKTQIETWERMINNYSRRDMKYFQDRLIALGGVASELAESWNDIYLAGLWRRTLVEQLGWYRTELPQYIESPFGRPQRPRWKTSYDCPLPACSPTWSWATVPGAVSIDSINYPDAKLIDWSVDLKSPLTPFGQVTHGVIVVEAQVLRMSDSGLKLDGFPGTFSDYDSRRAVKMDFRDAKCMVENCSMLYLGSGAKYDQHDKIFIIIEKSTDERFRRIGYARLRFNGDQWEVKLSLAERKIVIIE